VAAKAAPTQRHLYHRSMPSISMSVQWARAIALSASSTPSRLEGKEFASPAERLPSGREAAAAWLLCVFIAALALGVTSGLHDKELPAATVADKTAIGWHAGSVCRLPLACAEGDTAIGKPW
jgi:hypothetical protein